jgi:hypothetical protein
MKTFKVTEGGRTVEVPYPKMELTGLDKLIFQAGAEAYARALADSAGARHEAALMGEGWPDESEVEKDEL